MDLDLHGKKHSEVELIVENHILLYDAPFKIIVGNSSFMKETTIKILKKHNIKYIIWPYNLGSISILNK
jgi:hypothetical protein